MKEPPDAAGFTLLALFWIGLISAQVVLPLEMALMIPTMVGVMLLRFEEYASHSVSAAPARTSHIRPAS